MKFLAVLLLITIGSVVADSNFLEVFQNSKPFPQITLSSSGFGALGSETSATSLVFSAGDRTYTCSSFETALLESQPPQFVLTCRDVVPEDWVSGMAVFAEVGGISESVLVGYVYSEEQVQEENVGHTIVSHKRTLDEHEAFLQWATGGDMSDVSLGVELARNRLAALKRLRIVDPESTCHLRIPASIRALLPNAVLEFIEKPLDASALLTHVMEDHFDTKTHFRHNKIMFEDDTTLQRYASGRRANVRTEHPVPVWGFIFPGEFVAVISSSAAREAEPNEFSHKRSVAGSKIAVVAGKPVSVPADVDIHQFGLRVASLDTSDVARIPETRAKRAVLADPPSSTAIRPVKTLLYVYAYFANSARTMTVQTITYAIGNVSRFYEVSTFGKIVTLDLTVRIVELSKNGSQYAGYGAVETEARTLVAENFNDYDYWAVSYSGCCSGESWAGLASVGARGMWLRNLGVSVFVHEMGHNLVLGHSNYLDTFNARSIGSFVEKEYGHPADWMGGGGNIQSQFSVPHKDRIQVMPFVNIYTPTRSGIYRLYAHDTGVLNDVSKPQAFRLGLSRFLESNIEHMYYIEFRNGSTLRGVSINLYAQNGYEPRLLNANPFTERGAAGSADSSALPQGATFIDEQANLMITNRGADFTGPTPYVDLDIQFTTSFPGNRAPTGSISGPFNASLNGNGTFTVSASDPDDDALVYTWYADSRLIAARATDATVTIVFSSAGNRTVRCHINDGKGGLFIATYTVSVGRNNQAGPVVRGTVRDDNGQVIQRAHVWTTSGGYRGALTNNAGVFSIPQLPTNPTFITLNAQTSDSASCTPQFTNGFNLTTGAIVNGYDFVCTPLPRVSITTTAGPLANDTTGVFTITRTGSTSNSLRVPVYCFAEVFGTATIEGLSLPAGTNVTIPAGASSATITLRHLRSISSDRRQMTASCSIMESAAFIQTSATRASIALSGFAGPDNDHFANARVLSGLNVLATGLFNNASTEPYEPSTKSGFWQTCPSVWFSWSAPGNGFLVLSWNATFTSSVQVYAGDSIDSVSIVTSRWGRTVPLQVPVEQGTNYKIQFFSCNQPTWTPGRTAARVSNYTLSMSLSNAVFLPPSASPTPLRGGSGAPATGNVSSAVVLSSSVAVMTFLLLAIAALL